MRGANPRPLTNNKCEVRQFMFDAMVKQLNDGIGTVFECSASKRCIDANNASQSMPANKTCQLSVDHSARCIAYPAEQSIWLIDTDTTRIKPL